MFDCLISVIVSIYNVDNYLEKCIKSIINQSYKKIEIILIDDGSTDSSGKICDYYSNLDNRIKVIHKSNGGLSESKNVGIKVASGELLSFVDGDDYIEESMLEEMTNNTNQYGSDLVVCNYYKVYGTKKTLGYKNYIKKVLEKEDIYDYLFNYWDLNVYSWNKLYKKSIFDYISFPSKRIFEDSYVICDILDNIKKISYISSPLYNYVYRKDSISNSYSINYFDKIGSYDKIIERVSIINNKSLLNNFRNRKAMILIEYLSKMITYSKYDEFLYKKYSNELLLVKEIKWKDSKKSIKVYKLFKNRLIQFKDFEYKIALLLSTIENKTII